MNDLFYRNLYQNHKTCHSILRIFIQFIMAPKVLKEVIAKVEKTKARMHLMKVKHHSENTAIPANTKHLDKLAKKLASRAQWIRRWSAVKENVKFIGSLTFKIIEYAAELMWQISLVLLFMGFD
ncbi:hypothetical protein VM1G_07860 [Cytospora mali]|uniref:Uncharacterized protein n=1 Tax=Cytospora mali TaxID=578113 RepID=A0A194W7K6_CYTMA|nr:hypothetical protein VM1G_07860 [Valsa mali]